MARRTGLTLSWYHKGINYKITVSGKTGTVTATSGGNSRTAQFDFQPWLIHQFRSWNNDERTVFALTVLDPAEP